jgi:tetratricopeptide (TPR) repeat protein
MRMPLRLVVLLGLACSAMSCRPQTVVVTVTVPVAPTAPAATVVASQPSDPERLPPVAFAPISPLSAHPPEYDAALLEATRAEAERRYDAAVTALEKARSLRDTELVRQELDRLRALQARHAAAQTTVRDIQALIDRGQLDQADQLLVKALREYGSTDEAETLQRLKRQTDALLAAQARDAAARREQLRQQATAALNETNYRAALLALDQYLATGDDPPLRQRRDELQVRLSRYDQARERGLQLQRDPQQLELALAQFEEAAQAWDTPQVRQDISRCRLALQARRDRLAVAEFELRGDVGQPLLGRTLADELLPAFRGRFDLVERSQLAAVVRELKLEQFLLASDPQARADVGRMANVRFLVVGSITPLPAIAVHARLIDLRSGLIVQTARLVTPTPQEALRRAPELARLLLMTDQEQLAWEQQQWQQAAPSPVVAVGTLPPPPEFQPEAIPAPVVGWSPRPPAFGNFSFQQVLQLPEQPAGATFTASLATSVNRAFRDRLLAVEIELGDQLFRRGHFREAHHHYQIALNLAPQHTDILIRIHRCQPHLPPPVAVAPSPPPRAAVVNFQVGGDPRLLPPALSGWLAENFAPYLSPPLEVVDRGELYWYMGRLGLTIQDLDFDLDARLWLGRALGIRYLILGAIQNLPNGRISLLAVMVDTEFGTMAGRGEVLLRSPVEIKPALPVLAHLTLLPPAQRLLRQEQLLAEQDQFWEARQAIGQQRFTFAIEILTRLRRQHPFDLRFAVELQRAEDLQRQWAWEQARQQELARQQALAAEQARRQAELALAAEQARLRVLQQSPPPPAWGQQRLQAQEQLVVQARLAIQGRNFAIGIQLLESAVALHPAEDLIRELAEVRAQQAAAERQAAEELSREHWARRRQQEELERRAQWQAARQAQADAEAARRAAQAQADQAAYVRLLDEAQRQAAQNNWDAAVSMLQTARQLRRTDEVDRLLQQALMEQAKAAVRREDAARAAALERQLAEEQARRRQAEEEARRNWQLYEQALAAAQAALDQQHYSLALAKFEEAGKLYRTDAVSAGLRTAQLKLQEQAEADRRAKAEAEKQRRRQAELEQRLTEARQAENQKNWPAALAAAAQALELQPDHVEAQALLSRVKLAQEQAETQARLQQAEADRQARVKELVQLARTAAAAKQFDASELYLQQALAASPGDAQIVALKRQLDALRQADADAKARAAAVAKREAERQAAAGQVGSRPQASDSTPDPLAALLSDSRNALAAGQLDQAEQLLTQALRQAPADPRVGQLQRELQQARRRLREQQAQAQAAAKEKEEQAKRERFQTAMNAGRKALQEEKLEVALKHFQDAVAIYPGDSSAQLHLGMTEKRIAAKAEAEKLAKEHEAKRQAKEEADRGRREEMEQRQKAEAEAKAKAEAERRVKEEAEKKRAMLVQLVARGNSLVAAKKYQEALQAYEEAAKLDPENVDLQKRIAAVRQAAAEAKAEAERAGRIATLLAEGQTALQAKQLEAAREKFQEVLKLQPGHPAARASLQAIERALAAPTAPLPTTPSATRPTGPTSPRRELPTRPTSPAEPMPTRASPPTIPVPTRPTLPADARLEHGRLFQAGAAAERQRQWEAALNAYQQALRLQPADPATQAAVRRVEFRLLLGRGQKLLADQKFDEAAEAFEAALKLMPNQPEALRLLKQAREKKAEPPPR